MQRTTSKPTNWSTLLSQAAQQALKPKPAGAKTLQEIAKDTGFGRVKTYALVRGLVDSGKLTQIEGKEIDPATNRAVRRVWYIQS